ncbi:putative extracellular cellulase CelA/allergen Asp F7-like [Aspergillus affinis]|uniref:putative extracellular cellulase CelA/allergen Asp F7-like n=1 Tax=Aspergillus affinis TaxID=1070780 RepID=UPI0022FE46D9|nr:barwin-like endoglucanase [Aspergillus affinis]KAI9040640.1 barwin-like endoglucanase [Aspergillus affinis]
MKYQSIVSLGLAALGTASPVFHHKDNGQCPPGYSPSVYYITVTAEVAPTSTSSVELTTAVSSSTTSTTSTTLASETTVSTTQTPIQPTYQTLVEMPAPVATEAPATSEAEAAPVETTAAAEPSTTSSSIQQQPTVVVVSSESSAAAPAPSTTETEAPVVAGPTTTQAAKPAVTTAASSSSSNSNSNSNAGSSSSSSSSSGTSGATNSGKATFYGGNVSGGACSFSGYTIPSSLFGTALSQARWNDAASCGACVSVKGPDGNSVKAMIVDKCPECESNHLDLFETAFSELAATSEGIIPISWSFVPCGIDSPITLKNKEGTSAYWFSMQVVNANEPVEKLEVSTDGGSTWQATTRSDYNFFENESGFGTESVDVKVTAKSGGVVTVKNVGCQSGVEKEATSNF